MTRNADPSPFAAVADSVRLKVRLAPGAGANRIVGVAVEADGAARLKVAVTVPPEGGKANAAMIAMLAKTWRLPKGAFTLVAGHRGRRKTLAIAGHPGDLIKQLEQWMEEHHDGR